MLNIKGWPFEVNGPIPYTLWSIHHRISSKRWKNFFGLLGATQDYISRNLYPFPVTCCLVRKGRPTMIKCRWRFLFIIWLYSVMCVSVYRVLCCCVVCLNFISIKKILFIGIGVNLCSNHAFFSAGAEDSAHNILPFICAAFDFITKITFGYF